MIFLSENVFLFDESQDRRRPSATVTLSILYFLHVSPREILALAPKKSPTRNGEIGKTVTLAAPALKTLVRARKKGVGEKPP